MHWQLLLVELVLLLQNKSHKHWNNWQRWYKNPLLNRSASPSSPLQWRCADAKAIATMSSSSLAPLCPTLLCWGGQGDDDDNNNDLSGDDNVDDGQLPPLNTQQPAVVGRGWTRQWQKKQRGIVGKLLEDDGLGVFCSSKEEGGCNDDDNASCFAFGTGGKTAQTARDNVRLPGQRDVWQQQWTTDQQ
jgi:hypothetical protein